MTSPSPLQTASTPSPSGTPSLPADTHALLSDTHTWVFDLDNTLYSVEADQSRHIDTRIRDYLAQALNVGLEEAHCIQKDYFRKYGTTLRGMMLNHATEPQAYLDFVHDFDVTTIPTSAGLDAALTRLRGRKVIFTNADLAHAQRILKRLGIVHHFAGVFDIFAADFVPKPARVTYDKMIEHFAIDPHRAVMVEDIARNLEPAAQLGMVTVWLRSATPCAIAGAQPDGPHVDYEIDDLTAWLQAL